MSGKVVGWAFEQTEGLSPTQRFVLVAIADNADPAGRAWPSKKELARKTGLNLATVYRALEALAERGLFEERVEEGREHFYLAVSSQPANADSHGAKEDSQPANRSIQGTVNEPPGEPSAPSADDADRVEARRLCKLLGESAAARTGNDAYLRSAESEGWIAAMDRLMRIDGRAPEAIERAIAWVHDHSFWRSNVLSAPKLREKFDTLYLQAEREKSQRGPRRSSGTIANIRRKDDGDYGSTVEKAERTTGA